MKWDKEALVTEILADMVSNVTYGECFTRIKQKGSVSNATFSIYWNKAKVIKAEMEEKRRKDIIDKQSKGVLSVAKKGIKTKNAKILEIEAEIEELLGYISKGYIERRYMDGDVEKTKTEHLFTQELRHLHMVIEAKRDRLSKLLGEYAPTEKRVQKVKEMSEGAPSIIVTNERYSSTIAAKGQQSTDNQDK